MTLQDVYEIGCALGFAVRLLATVAEELPRICPNRESGSPPARVGQRIIVIAS